MAELNLNISEIDLQKFPNPRGKVTKGSVKELAKSIESLGLLSAVGVVGNKSTGYALFYGFRRLAACESLGHDKIKATVVSVKHADIPFAQIVENIQREELSEEAEGSVYQRMEAEGMGNNEIARRVGKSKSYISQRLSVMKSEPLKDAVGKGGLSMTAAREVASLPKGKHKEVIDKGQTKGKAKAEKAAADKAKAAADKAKAKGKTPPKSPAKPSAKDVKASTNKETIAEAKAAKGGTADRSGKKVGSKLHQGSQGKSREEMKADWKKVIVTQFKKEYETDEIMLSGAEAMLDMLLEHKVCSEMVPPKFPK
jgi:ParB family chromosome partitioning protein